LLFASVLLALEPNNKRIEGSFLKSVLVRSMPNAIVMFIPVLLIMIVGMLGLGISPDTRNAAAMIVVTLVGFVNLIALCIPFTKWRAGVVGIVAAGLALISGVSILLDDMLKILPAFLNPTFTLGMVGLGLSLAILLQLCRGGMEKAIYKLVDKFERKKTK